MIAGCVTKTYAPSDDSFAQQIKIKAGEEIQVVTTRRERLSFKITEVLDDRLVGVTVDPKPKEHRPAGDNVQVPFDELAMVRVTRFSAGHAAVFILLIGAMAAAPGAAAPAFPAFVP
jgi:hypothetical protein